MFKFIGAIITGLFVYIGSLFLPSTPPVTKVITPPIEVATSTSDTLPAPELESKPIPKNISTKEIKTPKIEKPISLDLPATSTPPVSETKKEIINPEPLKITAEETVINNNLSIAGILNSTNEVRHLNNLPPLTLNNKLNQSADLKVKDMFTKQYFEHVSPTGINIENLAESVGYEFIVIGENLALGNFGSDDKVVEAWFNSPGHRANLLNIRYTEIGLAVMKGEYEGRTTWMAVQEFGLPRSACPEPNDNLAKNIKKRQADLEGLTEGLKQQRNDLTNLIYDPVAYNKAANFYNSKVVEFNTYLESTKSLTEAYNNQVNKFNTCALGE